MKPGTNITKTSDRVKLSQLSSGKENQFENTPLLGEAR
jgi:hypothetical protein